MDIRPDLTAAHDRVWHGLAGPGTWLSGAERVDVARELRAAPDCALCRERKEALSQAKARGTTRPTCRSPTRTRVPA